MKEKTEEQYEAPETIVTELRFEGIICQSVNATMDGEFDEFDA